MWSERTPARRLARELVYPAIAQVTLALLVARSRLRPRTPASPFASPGGQRAVVVAAHPDDETIGCVGTMVRHLASGDTVCVLMVTDGSGSRAGGLPAGEMA